MATPYHNSTLASLNASLNRAASDAEQAANGPRRAWIAQRRNELMRTGLDDLEAWDRAVIEWEREHRA